VVSAKTGEAADKHLCVYCGSLYASSATLQAHGTRGCKSKPKQWKGSKVDKYIQRQKVIERQQQEAAVSLNGKCLKNVFVFKYLGNNFQADGDRLHALKVRMAIANVRFGEGRKVWKSPQISMQYKLRMFQCGVVSVLEYGCEVWMMTSSVQATLRGWCAKMVSKISGRSIRDECVDPTYDIISKVRARRLRWLGHVLRSDEKYIGRRVLLAQVGQWLGSGEPYPEGSILMDAPCHESVEQLVQMAEERDEWRVLVNIIKAGEGDAEEVDVSY
jgi:hypothetical protein